MLQIYIPAIFVFFRNFELSNEVEADSDLHSWPGDWNESPNFLSRILSPPNLAYEYVKRTIKLSRKISILHAMFRLYFQI